jgi:hypothetical protein
MSFIKYSVSELGLAEDAPGWLKESEKVNVAIANDAGPIRGMSKDLIIFDEVQDMSVDDEKESESEVK